MKVIGTAGHIDHGKSALVHRLSGIDPDRLSEEKRRGMTIDLGFAWLTLPSATEVSIVDVPGHERFVKNMLAGAGGIDVGLLVVAADEGVMPQTREHVDILNLLQVKDAVVAITKCDLVDEDWLQLVIDDVSGLLKGTTLKAARAVPVSSRTGFGITELLRVLDDAVSQAPDPPDRGTPYLPIDRVFTMAGFGTVVTGTMHDGSLSVGDEVEIAPGGKSVRIRSLQTHRRQVDEVGPGARAAVNLTGSAKEKIMRGDVLAPRGIMRATRRLDGRVTVLPDAPFALRHSLQVGLHLGAVERAATLTILEGNDLEPGESGWVQLRFAEPIAAMKGQRFILRLPAPARTVAGGEVVDVEPRHRRSDPAAVTRLNKLKSPRLEEAIEAALQGGRPRTVSSLATAMATRPDLLADVLTKMQASERVVRLGEAYLSAASWETVRRNADDLLQVYHNQYPLQRGMPKEELRSKLGWRPPLWPATLHALEGGGVLRQLGPLVAHPKHSGGTGQRRDEVNRVLEALLRDPFSPPPEKELLQAAGTDASLLAAMADDGAVVRVAEGVFFSRDAYESMLERTLKLIQEEGQVTVASIRDALQTSRKYVLAFLEHLDGERVTKRVGDGRVLGSKARVCR